MTYKTVDDLTIVLPESAVLARLGRNRHLSNISAVEQVKLKLLMQKAFAAIRPRGRWLLLEIVCISENRVVLKNGLSWESAAFAKFCQGAPWLWLGAVTVGGGIAELMQSQVAMSEKVVFDAVGSECADDCMNNLQKLAAQELLRSNLALQKMRFSPGYGNLSLRVQKDIFELLELTDLGMSLTGSCIMQPEKSVTAFAAVLKMI